jgi:hypothetical protein
VSANSQSEGLAPNYQPTGECNPQVAQLARAGPQESPRNTEKRPPVPTITGDPLIVHKPPATVSSTTRRQIPFEPCVRIPTIGAKELRDHKRVLSWAREQDRKRKSELSRSTPDPEEVPSGGELSRRSAAGQNRNEKRLRLADKVDAEILGEFPLTDLHVEGRLDQESLEVNGRRRHLSSDPKDFFPPTLVGPDDSGEPLGWFLPAMEHIVHDA